jgi:hypothetical protein
MLTSVAQCLVALAIQSSWPLALLFCSCWSEEGGNACNLQGFWLLLEMRSPTNLSTR